MTAFAASDPRRWRPRNRGNDTTTAARTGRPAHRRARPTSSDHPAANDVPALPELTAPDAARHPRPSGRRRPRRRARPLAGALGLTPRSRRAPGGSAVLRTVSRTLPTVVGNVSHVVQALIDNVDKVVRGKRDEIRLAVCCLLTEGHLLLDDVPGTGKTTLAKAIAGSIAGTWKRVQFTPDLLPTDITGVMVYDQRDRHVPLPRRPRVHQRADRRRDQPRQPEDPVGAARGDGGAPGHRRRRVAAPVPAPVLRDRHPEPDATSRARSRCPTSSSTASRCASHSATPTRHRGRRPRGVPPPPSATTPSRRSPTPSELDQADRCVDRIEVVASRSTTTSSGSPPPPGRTPICASASRPAARSRCCAWPAPTPPPTSATT